MRAEYTVLQIHSHNSLYARSRPAEIQDSSTQPITDTTYVLGLCAKSPCLSYIFQLKYVIFRH